MTNEEVRNLWFGDLNICGCAEDDWVIDKLRSELGAIKEHYNAHPDYLYFALLDKAGLIEHGTSIRGSWLTPLGEQFLEWLNSDAHENLSKILEAQ